MIELSYKEFETIIADVYKEIPEDAAQKESDFYAGWKAATSKIATAVLNHTITRIEGEIADGRSRAPHSISSIHTITPNSNNLL